MPTKEQALILLFEEDIRLDLLTEEDNAYFCRFVKRFINNRIIDSKEYSWRDVLRNEQLALSRVKTAYVPFGYEFSFNFDLNDVKRIAKELFDTKGKRSALIGEARIVLSRPRSCGKSHLCSFLGQMRDYIIVEEEEGTLEGYPYMTYNVSLKC